MSQDELLNEIYRKTAAVVGELYVSYGGQINAIQFLKKFQQLTLEHAAPSAHWTDSHIIKQGGVFVAYDEAGLEHGEYKTKDEARDALVIYSAAAVR